MEKKRLKQVFVEKDDNLCVPEWNDQIEALWMIERTDTDCGLVMDEHVHSYYELVFCFQPIHLRHTVAGKAYETDSPFIMFRAPHLLHSTSCLDDTPYVRTNIGFHPNVLAEFGGICTLGKLANCWECLIPTTTQRLTELQPLLTRLRRVRDPNVPKNIWISTLTTLLWEISEMADSFQIHDTSATPYVQELLQYVALHTEEDLSIDTLAERFYVSASKLKRDFADAVHMPFHEYISAIRIHRAKALLRENMPLAMVAQMCGVSSESALIVMFRRHTGMTPGEYRRRYAAPIQ